MQEGNVEWKTKHTLNITTDLWTRSLHSSKWL